MGALTQYLSAWDGLPLFVREWNDGDAGPPLLCLPGLVRTGGDFAHIAPTIGAGRRIVTLDYPGRGDSGWSRSLARHSAEACVRDVMDVCAALHLHGAVAIGTSFGGLLTMGLAAARPTLLQGVVLNDIGPEIGPGGRDFVRRFVGHDPNLESLEACVTWLRARLPPMSLTTEEEWREMAALTYRQGADGRFHPLWDIRIARTIDLPTPDLWPLFGALDHLPLLLIRGGVSEILLPATVERMRRCRPDMQIVTVEHVGHAPSLTEPETISAVCQFLAQFE
jgi:pimeloyl-ACP methyl ester carboxylesterase